MGPDTDRQCAFVEAQLDSGLKTCRKRHSGVGLGLVGPQAALGGMYYAEEGGQLLL